MTISILICDDLPEARATLHRYLRSYEQSHNVELDLETAADGAELLAMWRPGRWDMIFLDIFMPLIDGVEAARRLRKVDDKCEIVFATTSREHGMEGYELHAMDYLTKPIAQQDVDCTCAPRRARRRSARWTSATSRPAAIPVSSTRWSRPSRSAGASTSSPPDWTPPSSAATRASW